MGELLPILFGVLAGLIGLRLPSPLVRLGGIAAMSLSFGLAATLINGEELVFMLIDTAIVGLCAGVVGAAPRLSRLFARILSDRAARPHPRVGRSTMGSATPTASDPKRVA